MLYQNIQVYIKNYNIYLLLKAIKQKAYSNLQLYFIAIHE